MLILPEECRALLKEPFGRLFPDFSRMVPELRGRHFCTVGDVVTRNAYAAGLTPDVAVIDGVTRRGTEVSVAAEGVAVIRAENPAGTISEDLERALAEAVASRPALVTVDGEEDLAVLPLIGLVPDGWIILYGQPGEGAVFCIADAQLREKVREILALFINDKRGY